MMLLRVTCDVLLFIQVMVLGIAAQKWSVYYIPTSVCALKGSTVNFGCTYTYPHGYTVQKTVWTKQSPKLDKEPPDLSDDPAYKDRVQYLGDNQHNCTLRLSDVAQIDQSKYYFRFITDNLDGKYQGTDGVDLSVTDLQMEVPQRVTEGHKVILTCKTTCRLTVNPVFTWYKNGHRLSSKTEQLYLQKVSSEDTGRYQCGVRGLKLFSPEVTLNVRYSPKNTSVFISSSGKIIQGSLVTLMCISDANPPEQNYTWFKDAGASAIGSGQSYSFTCDSSSSGLYYCLAQNKIGSQKSPAMSVNINEDYIVILYVAFGFSLSAVAVLLTIIFWMRRKMQTRKTADHDYQNVGPNARNNTYTSLDPRSRSPDYDTLESVRN